MTASEFRRAYPVTVVGAVACQVLMAVSLQQAQPLVPRPVLKLIVEHPALAPYLHPEALGRVPLLVSDHLWSRVSRHRGSVSPCESFPTERWVQSRTSAS